MLWYPFRLQAEHRILFPLLMLTDVSTSPIYLHNRSANTIGHGYQSIWILRTSWSRCLRIGVFNVVRVMGGEGFIFVVRWLIGIVAVEKAISGKKIREIG